MFKKQVLIALLALSLPLAAVAGISARDLPANAQWYMYTDIDQIKKAESGKILYDWLEKEVFDEVREETGIDIGRSIHSLTAFANQEDGVVVVVDGLLTQDTRDRILAVATLKGDLQTKTHKGKTYYLVNKREGAEKSEDDVDMSFTESDKHFRGNGLEDEAYFSFAVENKILLTSNVNKMQQLLDSKGRIKGNKQNDGTLFVMTADRSFVQAGIQPGEFEDDTDFNSNVIRNAKQVALLIADEKGQIAVEANLVTAEAAMAESLGNIVRGLISLQVFNDEIPPEVSAIISSTRVAVNGATLSIKTLIDPATAVKMLNENN